MTPVPTDFNHMAKIHGPDAVRDRIEAAREPIRGGQKLKPLIVVGAAHLLTATVPARDMLLSPWLESQSLMMLYAWRGVGKTHVALGIAYALASGGEILGWKSVAPVPVLYIDGAMPLGSLRERVARIVASLFGQDVTPFQAALVTTPDGQQTWTTRTVEAIAEARMIELAEMGLTQTEVARELGCHRSTVLRALRKAEGEERYRFQPKARKSAPAAQCRNGNE